MKNVNVRLDDELHARVKESADAEGRSLNSQIAWLLKRGLGGQIRRDALDAYAQQNKDVHRENMMLRDENVRLRAARTEGS